MSFSDGHQSSKQRTRDWEGTGREDLGLGRELTNQNSDLSPLLVPNRDKLHAHVQQS